VVDIADVGDVDVRRCGDGPSIMLICPRARAFSVARMATTMGVDPAGFWRGWSGENRGVHHGMSLDCSSASPPSPCGRMFSRVRIGDYCSTGKREGHTHSQKIAKPIASRF
jgi:hypothetical protein